MNSVALPHQLPIQVLGLEAPALSLLVGLGAVILVRIMMMSRDPLQGIYTRTWWWYNISLTLLMLLITFTIIIDRQLQTGMSLIVGVGVGASGILIVDIMKKKVERFIEGMTS